MAVRQRPEREARGQHFLRSRRLAADLVREAGVGRGERIVDVGAGTGVLTRALLDAGTVVTALEMDPVLAAHLRRRFAGRDVSVVEADACRWSWPHESFSVVSNLPFSGSGAVLDNLLRNPGNGLQQADVIVQWEFAQKHSAVWPATLRGAYWRAWFELGIVARLSRSAFSPVPTVDAAVLRLARRREPLVPVEAHERYRQFLAAAFHSRVQLGRALKGKVSPRELRRLAPVLGFDASSYPRDLDARQWARVFTFVRSR
ncbi:MAG: methyltransferase domain-containing protein [Actinobacteria bacterium]|nr:methyltransferase domain-containing protein [Actinomycetota bacterium]